MTAYILFLVNIPRFLDMAEEAIPNFVGLKYTSNDLDQGAACLKAGRSVFLGADKILSAAITLGFDSAIMTTLSICPELSIKIIDLMKNNKLKEARIAQEQLNKRVDAILKRGKICLCRVPDISISVLYSVISGYFFFVYR